MRKSCCQFKIRKDINKSHPAGKCTLKHGGWEKKKKYTYRNTYSSQDFVCFFKILEENCHLAVIGRPFHESAKLPLHGLHGVPIESPSVEGGGSGRKGEMRRLGQTGGEFGIRMERRSLAKREGDSGNEKKGSKGSFEAGERERERASQQASKREGMKRESWHCSKRTHFAREN